jgi:hypothetical protein
MLRIRSIEPVIAVAPADDQVRRLQLGQFILNRPQGEKTAAGQLARKQFLVAFPKEQSQQLSSHDRKQPMQQRLFDAPGLLECFKQSSLSARPE